MAKKQKSFADKAAELGKGSESVYVKHIKSVKSEDTGKWRFNEQMVRMNKGETLDVALKRIEQVVNLVDIDLSQFDTLNENVDTDKTSDSKSVKEEDKQLKESTSEKESDETEVAE
tara:strand:- start:74 stop:421 length:348 start_codon:yes stop_codon:yes gene_type:complete